MSAARFKADYRFLPHLKAWAAACALSLGFAPTANALDGFAKPDSLVVMSYAGTGLTWSTAPQIIGIAKGLFKAENIDLQFVAAQQSSNVCQQILAKAVEVGQCSMNDVIQIVEASGAPLAQISNEGITALNYALMTKTTLKSWSDIKGKTLIVGGPKDSTVYYTRVMARANGIKDSEYEFIYAGASGARFAALRSGAVGGALLTDPYDAEATLQGYNRLDDLLPRYLTAENFGGTAGTMNRDFAKSHEAEVVAYIRAFRKSVRWIYDPANREELFKILAPKLNMTRAAFDNAYDKNVVQNKAWFTTGHTIDSAVQGIVNSLVELGSLPAPAPKASKFYDNTWADLVTQAGF
jgi:ABC-type nitrate/sulfonate/bicarbonate transport system substrate-binding protein